MAAAIFVTSSLNRMIITISNAVAVTSSPEKITFIVANARVVMSSIEKMATAVFESSSFRKTWCVDISSQVVSFPVALAL